MNIKISKLIILSATFFTLQSCGEGTPEKEIKVKLPKVEISEVEQKKFTHSIHVQGNIETTKDVLLTAEMGGVITSIRVKSGQKVSKGTVIATIDASILTSNLDELNTQLEYANYMLNKQEELNKRGVGSEFELETAKNQVKSLESKIKSLSTQKGKLTITAPFSGIIDQVFGKQGEIAGPSTPIVRLVNNNEVDIIATVSEKHLMNIKVGTPLKVTFPNYKDTAIYLSVTNVGNYIEPINRTFRIMSTIKNNQLLIPNMLADVEITDVTVNDGIVISSKAIQMDEDNNYFVYKAIKNDTAYQAKKISIEVILRSGHQTLISSESNLKPGDQIISKGAKGIIEDEIVRIK